ncbi:putative NHN endonuclease [Escherichia phage UPEC06]|nr:putative NHN endonuclease [Escherichia phage UPEC06]
MKLTIELIPSTAWDNNLRSYLTQAGWDKVRRKCYQEANYTCEVCGGKGGNGRKHPVEAHEIWDFVNGEVVLRGVIALCPPCHEVKHIGRAQATGNMTRAVKHFMKVNGVDKKAAEEYIMQAAALWRQRSKQEWSLNIDYLYEYMGKDFKFKRPVKEVKEDEDYGEAF